MGTFSLLQAAKLFWKSLPEKYEGKRYYHIFTDEVYGALEMINSEEIDPSLKFEEGIEKRIKWYLDKEEWFTNVISSDYQKYYGNMYIYS